MVLADSVEEFFLPSSYHGRKTIVICYNRLKLSGCLRICLIICLGLGVEIGLDNTEALCCVILSIWLDFCPGDRT